MTIDLHIHSKSSDGKLAVAEIVFAAKNRNIGFISLTDHDSIECQKDALLLTKAKGIRCVSGVELNVTFSNPKYREGKSVSLDFLGINLILQTKS